MTKAVCRIQADIAVGETDPNITCFVGISGTDDDTGETVTRLDTANPVIVKLSELQAKLGKAIHTEILQKRIEIIAARKATLDAPADARV